jgi:hypothetical protein
MKNLRLVLALLMLLAAVPVAEAQNMGATVIVQGGHTAGVTAGGALQVDVFSVNGNAVTGEVSGSVPVTIVSGAGSGGTASADEAAFTEGSTNFTPAGCYYATSPASLTTGHQGTFTCTATRHLNVNVADALPAGSNMIGKVDVLGNAGAAFDAATGAAPPANAILFGGLGSGATGGDVIALPVCDSYQPINVSTATTTSLITGVSGRHIRICGMQLITAGADNVALIEGTGATCGTSTAGLAGGTTAASGYNFAANGGITEGSGIGTIMRTATTGDSVCVVTSAAVQLSGGFAYAIY